MRGSAAARASAISRVASVSHCRRSRAPVLVRLGEITLSRHSSRIARPCGRRDDPQRARRTRPPLRDQTVESAGQAGPVDAAPGGRTGAPRRVGAPRPRAAAGPEPERRDGGVGPQGHVLAERTRAAAGRSRPARCAGQPAVRLPGLRPSRVPTLQRPLERARGRVTSTTSTWMAVGEGGCASSTGSRRGRSRDLAHEDGVEGVLVAVHDGVSLGAPRRRVLGDGMPSERLRQRAAATASCRPREGDEAGLTYGWRRSAACRPNSSTTS